MIKQVKAFTIMEVMITMLVSAIVISITYTCYQIILKNYRVFNDRQTELVALSQLRELMAKDIARGTLLLWEDDGIHIKSSDWEIIYRIQPDDILRISVRTDTFKVKTMELTGYFEGREVAVQNADEEANRIDELNFIVLSNGRKFPYNYVKVYSAQNLIKKNPYAIN